MKRVAWLSFVAVASVLFLLFAPVVPILSPHAKESGYVSVTYWFLGFGTNLFSASGPPSDYASFVEALTAEGLSVAAVGPVSDDVFSAPRRMIKVGEESVFVWEYPSPFIAHNDASSVSTTGSMVCRGFPFLGQCAIYDWVDVPHWYSSVRLIVLYVGHNPTIVGALAGVLGPQFAGG